MVEYDHSNEEVLIIKDFARPNVSPSLSNTPRQMQKNISIEDAEKEFQQVIKDEGTVGSILNGAENDQNQKKTAVTEKMNSKMEAECSLPPINLTTNRDISNLDEFIVQSQENIINHQSK